MSINDQILDAIELLAKSSVERAGYDKTIQAQIISCQDKQLGKYKCKYQDAIFYAYASNPEINLSNGSMVYILVPQNDMSKDKTIIGLIDKLGTDYVTIAEGENAYEKVTDVNSISSSNYPFYLDTDEANYSYDITQKVTIDQALSNYINKSSALIIAATIQTLSPLNKGDKNFNYGITFTLSFSNGESIDYELNENNMIGDPYNLISPTRQVVIFPIDGENFTGISKITIHNNYDTTSPLKTTKLDDGDIIISNLEIYGANRLSQEQLNGVIISFITPQGSVFLSGDTSKKIVRAEIKEKGRRVPSEGISFYWGLEDMNVTSSGVGFNEYLGYGWRYLTNDDYLAVSPDWDPNGDYIQLRASNIRTKKNRYKVAAIYNGNLISRQIDIENNGASVEIEIIVKQSAAAGAATIEPKFFNNMGNPTLQCETTGASPTSHRWGWSNTSGRNEQAADVIGIANGSRLQEIQIFKIINYADFKCTVYDSNGYLGTGIVTLTNEENDKANYLTIVNGTAVFKYTESGGAPNAKDLQNPQLLKPLTFELRDSTGAIIDPSTIATSPNGFIKWSIPKNNTLLQDSSANTEEAKSQDQDYIYYENVTTLSYEIASTFNYNKTNNQIGLQVNYNSVMVYAQTRLLFTKEGDVGTNGTEYTVKLALNTGMSTPPKYPMITKIDGGNYIINYGIGSSTDSSQSMSNISNVKLFKPQLWRSGECVWRDGVSLDGVTNPTVEWFVLINKYSYADSDDTDFTINPLTGEIGYIDTLGSSSNTAKACIIKCALTYEGKTYYGTIPITTAWVSNSSYSINLQQDTGFRYVIYTADGVSPQYDSTNPFTIDVIAPEGGSYTFNVIGGIINASTGAYIANNPSHLTELTTSPALPPNQKKYKPIGRYDGECINNTLVCTYGSYAKIRIPIHFLLNRFGQSNINAWDGNSVQIDSNGGFILAPQMGAGVKDNNNRFTGVLMGKVREAGKNNYNTGLFGYASGARSFFVNSDNGSAIFGKDSGGQIIIDPGNTKAMLYSSNFWKPNNYNAQTGLPNSYSDSQYNDAGMLIDLSTPQIVFKNKMLWLTYDGAIYAGKRTQNNTTYYNFSVDSSGNVQLVGDLKAGKISDTNYYNFEVNNSATGTSPLLRAGYTGTYPNYYNFVVKANGDVDMTGTITAKSGYIGEGNRKWQIGTANDFYANSYIRYGKQTLNDNYKGIYIGTDGISIYQSNSASGKVFSVDTNGNAFFSGDVTLGPNSTLSWSQVTNKPNDLAYVSFNNRTGDYTIENFNSSISTTVPHYITSAKITQTTIESPNIYGGVFYATGLRDINPSYYISPGLYSDGTPKDPIGYIAYDSNGAGTEEENRFRVIMETVSHVALKLRSSGNLSLTAGAYTNNMNIHDLFYDIHLDSFVRIGQSFSLAGDAYGYSNPEDVFTPARGYDGIANYVRPGQVYFKLDS